MVQFSEEQEQTLLGVWPNWGAGLFTSFMSFRYTGNHGFLHDGVYNGLLLQAVCASKNIGFTDRFEHMHPGVCKEAHASFYPIFQLNIGLMFMDKWSFYFDVTPIVYSS